MGFPLCGLYTYIFYIDVNYCITGIFCSPRHGYVFRRYRRRSQIAIGFVHYRQKQTRFGCTTGRLSLCSSTVRRLPICSSPVCRRPVRSRCPIFCCSVYSCLPVRSSIRLLVHHLSQCCQNIGISLHILPVKTTITDLISS